MPHEKIGGDSIGITPCPRCAIFADRHRLAPGHVLDYDAEGCPSILLQPGLLQLPTLPLVSVENR